MKSKYGASYELTEEQLKVRWETFDISGNGGVSEEDFNKSMLIKLIFYDDHYPFEGLKLDYPEIGGYVWKSTLLSGVSGALAMAHEN